MAPNKPKQEFDSHEYGSPEPAGFESVGEAAFGIGLIVVERVGSAARLVVQGISNATLGKRREWHDLASQFRDSFGPR